MPWIKLDTGFYTHPKTAELLSAPRGAEAVVALQRIWCWAGETDSPQARDGHIPDAVLRLMGITPGQAQRLADVGYLHRNGTGWHIHGWDDHQGALIDRRAKDRERKRAARDRSD